MPGTYILQLVLNDYFTDSSPSTVTITANPIKSRISVTPNFSIPLSAGTSAIPFDVNNTGRIGVSNGTIDITLKDPDGVAVYSGTQTFSIAVGQTKTVNAPVNISSLKFGNYTLTYTQSDETNTGSPTTVSIPNSAIIEFSFDKISYKVRETANLTLNLTNTGKFNLDTVSVLVSVLDAGYTETRTVSLSPSPQPSPSRGEGALVYAIPIPATIIAGQHNVNVTFTLPSGSSVSQSTKFTVPESSLTIGYSGPTSLKAGDTISLTIENVGGVDTSYITEKFTIVDSQGVIVYQGNITGTVLSGEIKTLANIQVPLQTATDLLTLQVALKDTKTGNPAPLYKVLYISGLEARLSAMTDKDLYLNTEAITGITTLKSGSSNVENGSIEMKVIKYIAAAGFSHFLPKTMWESFYYPSKIGVGPDGSMYVVDGYSCCVHKFDSNWNFITKWGSYGNGDGQFNGPYGIAVAPDGAVYVVDSNNNRIQKFDSNGNFITKWGSWGSGNGQFYNPEGIAVAPDGSVYVADTSNNRIQKFDSNGNFITKWGNYGSGNGQFSYPLGIAVGPDGSVYVADTSNYRIQKFDSNGNFITKWGSYGSGDGQFGYPRGIATASDGSVYVADTSNYRIQKFDSNGNFITKLAAYGGDGQFHRPYGVSVGPDDSVYIADTYNHRIQKFDSNGKFIAKWGSWGSGNGQFYNPEGIAVGPDGSVYVADTYNIRVQKFDSNGNFITKWGSYGWGDGQFRGPRDITVASDGSVYVADDNNSIQKFDSNGNFITKWGSYGSGNGQFSYPLGIAIGPDGSVYVADTSNYRIQKFDSNGNFITKWGSYGSGDGQFYAPSGIAVDLDGFVYVTNLYNDRVQKFDSNGNFIAKWGGYGSSDVHFNYPYGIAVGHNGSVYVADTYNHRIQRMVTRSFQTLFETTISLTQSANTSLDYTTNIGVLNTTGKLYLQSTLKNSLAQTIATAEYPFYIVDGNTVIMVTTDKKVYRQGETVTITGEVRNLATVSLDNAVLLLNAGTSTFINQTITVLAGGTYPFTFTTTAGAEGVVSLIGTVSQNNLPLVEVVDRYEVAAPSVAITATAPDVVGRNPFDLSAEVRNAGKVDVSGQWSVISDQGNTIDNQQIIIPAGETKLFPYTQQITSNTTYTVTLTGDVTQTVTKTVVYGEAARIEFTPSPQPSPAGGEGVFPEGKVGIPVTITNTGQVDETITVDFSLQPSAISETRNYYLPKGGSVTDTLYYDLASGSYQLSAISNQPYAFAQTSLTVVKENDVAMTNVVGSQGEDGLISVTVSLTNNGYNEINGTIQLLVINNQGKNVWQGEALVSGLKSQTSQNYQINVNSAGITSGVYRASIVLYSSSGQQIATNEAQVRISGPIFEITAMPNYPTFTVGKQGSFTFAIKNTGTVTGTTSFSVKAMDALNQSVTDTFNPGEEKTFTFSFTVPEDAEEKDYLTDYVLIPVSSHGMSGQVKFHVAGVNIRGTASLDKEAFSNGDTAVLTLNISKLSQFEDGDYLAIIRYGAYHDMKQFTLSSQPAVLAFNVSLNEITGENLFYSIHFTSGRTIYRSAVSINKAQPDLFIEDLSASQGSLTTYKFSAVIVNQGERASEATTMNLYDGDPSSGASPFATIPISSLNKDESVTVTYEWNVLGKAGSHTIYAAVDPNNIVTEWIETNNTNSTDATIPNVALSVFTSEPSYKANQDAGIVFNMANLTPSITYQGPKLDITIIGTEGASVFNSMNDAPTLLPASETSYAMNWNTQTNAPGDYTVNGKLMEGANILTQRDTIFTILNTPSLTGGLTLSKDMMIQGLDLRVDYNFANNGNIDLSGGEAKVEFIRAGSQITSATFTQTFGALTVLATLSQALNIQKIEVEPGDYMVRLTAAAEGQSFIIGEKSLKVLPPLEITKGISLVPRVLILLDEGSEVQYQGSLETLITHVLNSIDAYYQIVRDKYIFKDAMRSGIYNMYILTNKGSLEDQLDKELAERINSGEGLMLLNFEKVGDSKLSEVAGIKLNGYLSDTARTLTLIESPITGQGSVPITGKVQKLEIASNNAVVAGTIEEGGILYPGIVSNPYGNGKVVIFAFDIGKSAKDSGNTLPYTALLSNALRYAIPQSAMVIPHTSLALGAQVKSLGASFDLKVKETVDTSLPILLTYPEAQRDQNAITWEFKLFANETREKAYLVRVPEEGGTYTSFADIYYLRNGGYEFYHRYSFTTMSESLADLEMRILTQLQAITDAKAREITETYKNVMSRIRPGMKKEEIQSAINDIIKIIERLAALNTNTDTIRLEVDKLLIVLERKWVETIGQ